MSNHDGNDDDSPEDEEVARIPDSVLIALYRAEYPEASRGLADAEVLERVHARLEDLAKVLFADGRTHVSIEDALAILREKRKKKLH